MRILTIACVATAFAAALPADVRPAVQFNDVALIQPLSSGGSARGGSVSSGSKSGSSSSSNPGSKSGSSSSNSGSKSSNSGSKGSSGSSSWRPSTGSSGNRGYKNTAAGAAGGAAAGAGLVCVANNNNTIDPNALNNTNGTFTMNCTQQPTSNGAAINTPGSAVAYNSAALFAAALLTLL
ncbi:hypothetical protein A1Q2_01839 [Trichosporon asahii var. asahii CBS 8904]|uniref:Hydrophobin n=2 Tax=Trichosporon asahii var. asahii TaxID=189963 RepID=K1VTD8_TRIAC|nr:hypothetical protein A1Q1_04393 [Trichosporon asahii var. asahii CBS 2479]EJT46881.1 hypothetical protein A1Q1_04393 [Trichosporon asahii var. asahii CBS 2479]EKD03826.1 hypothetical protein A1Q2_01839 [Trichosporon asahii var. asahii CBS 8904]